MNTNYIHRLIRLVEESEIESLEVSSWGRKVKITQKLAASSNGHNGSTVVLPTPPPAAAAPPREVAESQKAVEPPAQVADNKSNLVEIKSPMVGTFYRAPSPDADPYVSVNERITEGQVVCIVEAMKLMNEIESEVSGRVVELLVENAKPVEFGQVLFRIDPKA